MTRVPHFVVFGAGTHNCEITVPRYVGCSRQVLRIAPYFLSAAGASTSQAMGSSPPPSPVPPVLSLTPTPSTECEPGLLPRAPSRVCDNSAPHPALAIIRQHIAAPRPAWLPSLQPVLHDELQQPLGEGRRYTALLLPPPACQYSCRPTFQVAIHPPANYPDSPPLVRWTQLIRHSQIPAHGVVPRQLLDGAVRNDSFRYCGGCPEESPPQPRHWCILSTLELCRDMLLKPIANNDRVEEFPTDEEILHFWQHHEAGCSCLSGSFLPCDYTLFPLMTAEDQRLSLESFRDKFVQLPLLEFEGLAASENSRQACIDAWTDRSSHPALFAVAEGSASWPDDWIHPALAAALAAGDNSSVGQALTSLLTEEAAGVYSFPMFTEGFCDLLVREVLDYEGSGLPAARPNSMNNYALSSMISGWRACLTSLSSASCSHWRTSYFATPQLATPWTTTMPL